MNKTYYCIVKFLIFCPQGELQTLKQIMSLSSLLSSSQPKKHQLSICLEPVCTKGRLIIPTHVLPHYVSVVLWQVHWNMHSIFCIQSIFRRPTSAKRNTPMSANRVCQQGRMRQMWAGSGQTYSFSSARGGLVRLTAGDSCPTSHQCSEGRQRWSETCLG